MRSICVRASPYGPHAELSERLYRRYTAEQLEQLLEFTRRARGFNEQQAALVEERARRAS